MDDLKKAKIELHNKTHLIPYKDVMCMESLEDLMLIMAKNVESSLIEAGAEKGEDYTVLDLFKLGMPFALEMFKDKNNKDKITFSVSD